MAGFENNTGSTSAAAHMESANSAPKDESPESDRTEDIKTMSRPIGRRKGKDVNARDEMARKKLKLAEEVLAAQNWRNEIMQTHSEMLLFPRAPTGSEEDDVADYLKIMRKRVLKRLKGEANKAGENSE